MSCDGWLVEVAGVATGRVIRFNATKGFGFVAPDDGGEDVFLHASALLNGDPETLRPGMVVEFEPIESGTGTKALTARIVGDGFQRRVVGDVQRRATDDGPQERVNGDGQHSAAGDDADLCDIVSAAELVGVVTDVLLAAAPSLTGTQIIDIRDRLVRYARARRWLED